MADTGAPDPEPRAPGEPSLPAKITFWLLAIATLAAIAAVIVRLRPDPGLWISLIVVWLVFWLALWLVAFVSKEPSAKDIGVALLTGLVLAGAAFVLNFVLEEALASRDRERRESETKLAINRRDQFVFRGEDFRDFDLQGMALVSSGGERFDLSFADLTGANLAEAELRRVLLRNAILLDASLQQADLADANLRGATLTGADFTDANLSGADLTEAVGFDETGAVLSEDTVCDTGRGARFSEDRFTCTAEGSDERKEGRQVFLVSRKSVPGTVVGQVAATDPDADVLTYTVVGGGDPRFNVDARTGVITVAAALDTEPDPATAAGAPSEPEPCGDASATAELAAGGRVELTVCVSDGENDQPVMVAIVIESENEPPEPVLTYLVHEGSAIGSRVGRIQPPPEWDMVTDFVIEAGDSSGLFEFDERQPGMLKLAGKPPPGTSYVLNVRIRDAEKGTTRVPVQVTVIGDNSPPTVLTDEPLTVTAGSEPGTTVGVVGVEDGDGDGVAFSLASIVPEGTFFEIDPVSGAVVVGEAAAAPGEYVLAVVVTDTGIPPRSVEADVRVQVEPALTAALPHRYLVADGGMITAGSDDGVLSAEQRAAGVTAQLTVPPESGRLNAGSFPDSGTFAYAHTAGAGPDSFRYRTVDATGEPRAPAEVTIAVVTAEPAGLDSASLPGVVAAQLEVEGVDPATVTFSLEPGGTGLFALGTGGNLVTTAPGAQLFDVAPWHDVTVVATDLQTDRTTPVSVVVPVDYVVEPGDALTPLAAQALAAAAASGRTCPDTAASYAARIAEASEVGGLDPGERLVFPDCRPGA